METILKANKIPFKALDIATDEKARMLWGRRAGKDESGRQRKIPGLVQMGLVIGVSETCPFFTNGRLTITGYRRSRGLERIRRTEATYPDIP
jgi:hypothetical protein